MRVWLTGAGGFVGSQSARGVRRARRRPRLPVTRGGRRHRPRRGRPQRGRVPPRRARALRDPQRPGGARLAPPRGVGRVRGRNPQRRRSGRRRAGRAHLHRLGVRRHAGRRDRGRATEPGQRLRLPQGGVRARCERACKARRRGPNRRRPGRPPCAAGNAARPGPRLRVFRRIARAGAAGRRAVHRLGGRGHQHARDPDAGHRRGRARLADAGTRARRRAPLLRRRVGHARRARSRRRRRLRARRLAAALRAAARARTDASPTTRASTLARRRRRSTSSCPVSATSSRGCGSS